MAGEASGDLNLSCGSDFGDDGGETLKQDSEVRKFASYEGSGGGGDDDILFSASSFQVPTVLPVKKRTLDIDNNNSSHSSAKKSKVSLHDDEEDDDDDMPISWIVKRSSVSADKSLSMMKKFIVKELDLLEKAFEECRRKRQAEELRLHSLERQVEECTIELDNKKIQVGCIRRINEIYKKLQMKIEECVCDFVTKETSHSLMEDLVKECELELKTKQVELEVLFQKIAQCTKDMETKEGEFDAINKLFDEQEKELESERKKLLQVISTRTYHCAVKDIESMKKQQEGRSKELESIQKRLEDRVKEFDLKEEEFVCRVKEIESNLGSQEKDIDSKKKQLEGQLKELVSKEKQLEGRADELELKENRLKGQLKEFKSKEEEFEGRVQELELKENQLKGQIKEFESKEEQLSEQVKDLESKNKHSESLMEEIKTREKELEDRVEELELKEKQLKSQVNEFESKKEEFVEQVKDLESKKKHYESLVEEELKSKEKKLEGRLKEIESKEKQLEDQVKEFELKMEEFESQVKELKSDERREKQNEVSVKSIKEESELDNQLSPTIDGRSLQMLPSEQTDEQPESIENNILAQLKATSDPSKVVLDIIQNPIVPPCMKGDNAVIIESSHILILEQLMRISPHVKPHVREEAMRLALDLKKACDLKANMRENSVNSLVVLCFLQLLSIYGLLSSFDEDEVLKLFDFAAHHKQTVELFQTLGFTDKVSDFVQSLIKKEQYFEAVRFICAFKLEDKNQPVDLLRKYAQNAKLISGRICKNTMSLEIKDDARDQEIASLKSVQQCISDNNLESEDLINEIQHRINELSWEKGIGVYNLRKRKASNGH
ncbi:uncharacterized protein LOC130746864 isoform X2 [Lotus japonicus]|uniref:uncharacterized protein LOC130746864 isoform X2 n=1 Tax=Lotus japonicus TaxID=34305 RepID=UPI002584D4D2|nr:uncharacterized protein LOC130746864 isoform X2 [Lotus japonicus]